MRRSAHLANFFTLFGTRITLGRDFLAEGDQPGRDHVAILSYSTWLHRLGAQPDIEHLTLNDISYTVVGVLPREFEFVCRAWDFQARNQFDVWVPLALNLATGLFLASAAMRVFSPSLPTDLPRASTIAIDVRVVVFTSLISLSTGMLFELAPLFQAQRVG